MKIAVKLKQFWVIIGGVVTVFGLTTSVFLLRVPVKLRYVAPVKVGDYSSRPYNPRLVAAADKGDIATVSRLLEQGASSDAVDSFSEGGKEALEVAAAGGHLSIVRLLLDKGADINAPDFWGGTALVDASAAGQTEVVKLLLSRGADVDADDDGATALGYAQHQGHHDIVTLLEQAGAR